MLKEQFFNTGTVAINYAEGPPSGPPLVLIHGGAWRWQAFLPLIPVLSVRWQIYARDLRGHGKSGHVPGQYRVNDYAADIEAFLKHRLTEPAILFGHSLGGMVAITVAARQPEAVKAVIVGDSPLYLGNLQDYMNSGRDIFVGWRNLAGSGRSMEAIIDALIDRWGDVPGQDTSWLLFMAKNLSQLDPDVLTVMMDDFDSSYEGYEIDELLPAISCPVLILQANPSRGGLLTDEEVDKASTLLANAIHIRFENLGHGLHLDQAEPVLRSIVNFLELL